MDPRGIRSLLSRRTVLTGATATVVSGLFACTRNEVQPDESGRVRLRFAVGGRAGAAHGGFYQAIASGAYERRSLTVEIVQGDGATDVAAMLASGQVELGLGADSYAAMDLAADGAPVRAVAAYFQRSPQALIAHPGPDLATPADLAGQPIYVPDTALETSWAWLKARYGFTDSQLRRYAGDPAAFVADDSAVLLRSLLIAPTEIGGVDFEPRTLLLADDGYPPYAGLVLAPTAFARDNATALRSFVVASAEGWRDYIQGDPRPADALIRRADPTVTQRALDQAREVLRADGLVAGGDAALYGLGTMTEDRWRDFFVVTSQAGAYPDNLDWRQAFTTQYLPGRG